MSEYELLTADRLARGKSAIAGIRKLMKTKVGNFHWDNRMTIGERVVLLRAAQVSHIDHYSKFKFSMFSPSQKKMILDASVKASAWAKNLSLAS